MKTKILAVFMAVLMIFPLASLLVGSNVAFADNDHGKRVSEAAKNFKGTKGEHGKFVSSIAREKDDDDDEDEDEHRRGPGPNTTSTPSNIDAVRIQLLERFIAFLQEQIQILINRLTQLKGGVNAPVISSVSVLGISISGATISWVTNETATSKVYVSTSSPVVSSTAAIISDSAMITSHSVGLSGLVASTTYYFFVESVDADGNVSRSFQSSFKTLDIFVAGPVISSVSVSGISSSTATVSWITDASSTSKVYYSTSTPVNLAIATTVSSTALVISHSLDLAGLSANANYFFIVESADAYSNVSRSSQFSFTTLP